ncbi:MAG: calcium/sodium antiporter [Desulfuromonadales bacterium]|nr:calcium/sodium antiporter [Desulfuromonadales bacterium]
MSLLTLLLFLAGLAALLGGAELLVRGAARLAAVFGISPLVIGLTVVAFGTSSPELAVSVMSATSGQADIAIGNVIGSNICNVLLILGLSALITPLVVAQQLVRLDVPLMIGASLLFYLFALDGRIGRLDGLVLFAGVLVYTVWAIRRSRLESREIQDAYAKELGEEVPHGARAIVWQLLLAVAGLGLLTLGSNWLVEAAVAVAMAFGVSELIIGLTIISFGTSLPEVATSVMASVRGQRDIAVGNVVGSNLFNILAVLGLTATVAPEGVAVAASALHFDLPVMLAVMIACLPIFFTGHCIARWEGGLFFGYYLAYIGYLVLASLQHEQLPLLSAVMLWFVLPLTAVTLLVTTLRAWRERYGC